MFAVSLLFIIMLILVALGIPLVYSIGAASIIILLSFDISGPAFIASRMFAGIDSFMLCSIPFFLLAAELLARGGLVKRLLDFIEVLLGHVRGALAQTNIVASLLFSGIQASATADTAAIGGLMIPAMKKKGYDADFSVVVTATSSCLGPIIPPSILMVLYGFLTGTSIARLFIGGIIPGLILGILLMVITHYWVIKRKYEKRKARAPIRKIVATGLKSSPAFLVPVIIIGGLLFGIVTPTEAGVLACVAAFIVSFFYKELTLASVLEAFKETARTTCKIFAVIAVSSVFSEILTRYLFATKMLNTISSITTNPTLTLLILAVIIFFLGMVIDTTPLLIMLAAPLFSAGMALGIDPVHLGVVLVMSALIGTITPPVSLLLCLGCSIAKIRLSDTFGILWSYLLIMIGGIFLIIIFPSTVTLLQSLF